MDGTIWFEILKSVVLIMTGGGVWGWIKAREDKRKTPYDMFRELMVEQKKFYEERNADYEREKLDSAEKSSVIMQSHFCKHKYTDPNVVCPVDVANDARLKKRCDRCGYAPQKPEETPKPMNDETDRFDSDTLHGDPGRPRRSGGGYR